MDRLYALSLAHVHGALYIERGFRNLSRKDQKQRRDPDSTRGHLTAKQCMHYLRQRRSKWKSTEAQENQATDLVAFKVALNKWGLSESQLSCQNTNFYSAQPIHQEKVGGGAMEEGTNAGRYCKMRDLHFRLVLEDRCASKSTRPPIWWLVNLLCYSGPDITSLN